MSASIFYQPVNGIRLRIGSPSSFIEKMSRLFGPLPWNITAADITKLDAFAAGLDDLEMRDCANMLATMAYEFEHLRVWAEY